MGRPAGDAGRARGPPGAEAPGKRAGATLTLPGAASEELLAGARTGRIVELGHHADPEFRPDFDALDVNADWGPERQIPADLLLDVLTGRTAVQAHSRGVRLRGARVTGDLDWDWQRLPVALELVDCIVDSSVNLDHAQVAGLSLIRCRLPGFSAEQMRSSSTLKLVGSVISGPVNLRDATVSGAVLASGAVLHGQIDEVDRIGVRVALLGTRLQVSGAVMLDDGFAAEGVLLFPGARIGGNLHCSGGRISNPGDEVLQAQGAEVNGSVLLGDGLVARGRVVLDRAKVGGDVVCDGSTFDGTLDGSAAKAFSGNRMEVAGGLFMRGEFTGSVRLFGARIGGSWTCQGATFVNPVGAETIWASGSQIAGSVYFNLGFSSAGSIRMRGAQIGGNLVCFGGRFVNPGGAALRAVNLILDGDLLLGSAGESEPFSAEGEVSFLGARISGLVDCRGGRFTNPGSMALSFVEAEIIGNANLGAGLQSSGEVSLRGTRIGGQLSCTGSQFSNAGEVPAAIALNLVGIDVDDSMLMYGTVVSPGQVRMNRARIGGVLEFGGSQLHNRGGFALFARAIKVGAGVFLDAGFVAEGSIRLSGAQITGDLNCETGTFTEDFLAAGSTVSGSFRWRQIVVSPAGTFDLRRTVVGELDDDLASWPDRGGLWLAGFGYGRMSDRAPRSPTDRVKWIRRQQGYHPEPYQQLAAVYRSNGQISEATTVAIAQQDDLLDRGDLTRPARAWAWFLGRSLGHGYRPGRAAWGLLALYIVTLGTVWLGARTDSFIQVGNTAPQPAVTSSRCSDSYPCLSVPAYALENITPILNLHQGENWHPKSSTPAEWLLRDWLYLSTVVGYAGTTLLAAGLSGLARSA